MSIATTVDTVGAFPMTLRDCARIEALGEAFVEAERRRDLVPYSEVLAEFGREVALRASRAPAEVCERMAKEAMEQAFRDFDYWPERWP